MRTCSAAAPDSPPESYLPPTRPPRQPAQYVSGTLPGVTPPSGPRLISMCIQPSPRARLSVGLAERDGSRFLRPDPPPWWGRRGSGTFSTSRECPPNVTPSLSPRPFQHLSLLPWWARHCSSWDPVDSPLVGNLTLWSPRSCPSSRWQPSPRPSPIVYLQCPITRLQLDAFTISLNVLSSVVCRMRPCLPWLALGLDQRGSSHPGSAWVRPHPRLL